MESAEIGNIDVIEREENGEHFYISSTSHYIPLWLRSKDSSRTCGTSSNTNSCWGFSDHELNNFNDSDKGFNSDSKLFVKCTDKSLNSNSMFCRSIFYEMEPRDLGYSNQETSKLCHVDLLRHGFSSHLQALSSIVKLSFMYLIIILRRILVFMRLLLSGVQQIHKISFACLIRILQCIFVIIRLLLPVVKCISLSLCRLFIYMTCKALQKAKVNERYSSDHHDIKNSSEYNAVRNCDISTSSKSFDKAKERRADANIDTSKNVCDVVEEISFKTSYETLAEVSCVLNSFDSENQFDSSSSSIIDILTNPSSSDDTNPEKSGYTDHSHTTSQTPDLSDIENWFWNVSENSWNEYKSTKNCHKIIGEKSINSISFENSIETKVNESNHLKTSGNDLDANSSFGNPNINKHFNTSFCQNSLDTTKNSNQHSFLSNIGSWLLDIQMQNEKQDYESNNNILKNCDAIKKFINLIVERNQYYEKMDANKKKLKELFEEAVIKTEIERNNLKLKGECNKRFVDMIKRLSVNSKCMSEEAMLARNKYNKAASIYNDSIKHFKKLVVSPELHTAFVNIIYNYDEPRKENQAPTYLTAREMYSASEYTDLIEAIKNN